METTTLLVPKIHCEGCVANIAGGVEQLPGVSHVEGDPEAKTVTVAYEPARVDLGRIKGAIAERGFAVERVLGSSPAVAADVAAPHEHAKHRGGEALRLGIAMLAVAAALALGGYLLGFLGFAYGVAVPQAFGRFSVVAVAAISGLAAFFSPCVFPLLPGYVTYQLGASGQRRLGRAAAVGLAGAAGIVLVNLAIGLLIAALGAATPFTPDPRQDIPAVLAVRFVAGAAIVVLGLLALGGRTLGHVVARLGGALAGSRPSSGGGLAATFAYGLTYNAAGIGCTGPILLALVLYALASGEALLAFAVFSLTMGALMFAVTVASGLAGRAATARLATVTEPLQRLGAIILVVFGTYTMLSLSFGPTRELFVRTFLPFLP